MKHQKTTSDSATVPERLLIPGPECYRRIGSRAVFIAARKQGLIRAVVESTRDPLYDPQDVAALPSKMKEIGFSIKGGAG